jgi:hypothetical protein
VSQRLSRELLCVIVAIAAWGCFIAVVVVNVGVVMGAGISADVTDVTIPS